MRCQDYTAWGIPDYELMETLRFTQNDPLSLSRIVASQDLDPQKLSLENDKWDDVHQYPVTPLVVMIRQTKDPLKQNLQFSRYTISTKIYTYLSMRSGLHIVSRGNYHPRFGVLHNGELIHGTEKYPDRAMIPASEIADMVSHEGGEYPLLTIVSFDNYYTAVERVREREKAEKQPKHDGKNIRQRATRFASFKFHLPRLPNFLAPSRSNSPDGSVRSTTTQSSREDNLEKDKLV